MLKGEKQLTADDVLATLANADLAEEESTPLTPEEKEAFGIKDCSVCGDPLEENGDSDTCQTNRSPAKDSPDVG